MGAKENPGVVMLISKFFPEMGGAEKQLKLLVHHLHQSGISVWVVTRNYHGGPSQEMISGAQVLRAPTWGSSRTLNSLSFLLFAFFSIFKLRKKVHLIHCHQMYSPLTAGVLAGKVFRKPVLVKVTASHDLGEVAEIKRLPFLRIRKWLISQVRLFLVVNPWITKELKELNVRPDRTLWVPNGTLVPNQKKASGPVRKKLGIPIDSSVVVYCGRLSAEKGLEVLIEAWKGVVEKKDRVCLYLIGAGGTHRNVEKELKKRVQDCGLEEHVKFTGQVDNVADYLAAADVFTLLSVSEGMSNSLLEAMASGLPCVVSDIPANRILIQNAHNGFLVDRERPQEIGSCIQTLLDSQELCQTLGSNARGDIEKTFSMSKVTQKIVSLYEEVIS